MDQYYGTTIDNVKSIFEKQATRQGWDQTQIDEVLGESQSYINRKDYDTMFNVIKQHCIGKKADIIDW